MVVSYLLKLAFWSGILYWIAGYWSWWWPILYSFFALNYQMGFWNGRTRQMEHDHSMVEALTNEVSELRIRVFKAEAERDDARDDLRKPRLVKGVH